ncbi:hypothetical protein ACPCG0_13980 [Propionibacteriaceae bacterium Y1923]|uniref:hypothetical protein n=1 Tax=Aestuariimicrobium sp. Y1814 TaxID=3418742 RepID=UPI003C1E9D87
MRTPLDPIVRPEHVRAAIAAACVAAAEAGVKVVVTDDRHVVFRRTMAALGTPAPTGGVE